MTHDHRIRSFATALAAGALALAAASSAVARPAEVALVSGGQTCDGKGTYRYVATWRGAPNATFYVNSGNGCKSSGQVCGVSTKSCVAQCSKLGDCRVVLHSCGAGHPGRWSSVIATDRSQASARLAAPPPGRCL